MRVICVCMHVCIHAVAAMSLTPTFSSCVFTMNRAQAPAQSTGEAEMLASERISLKSLQFS